MSEVEKYKSFDELKKQPDSSIGQTSLIDMREFINFVANELGKQGKLKSSKKLKKATE